MDVELSGRNEPEKSPEIPASLPARFERLPLTRFQRRLHLVVATAFLFDALDIAILTFVLAPISDDFGMSKGASGLLASVTFAGMGIGASLAGMLSDRFGRRPVFAYSMLFWGATSLLTAFAWDVDSLLLFRFLTGIGMGAELPVAVALLSEFLPAKGRAHFLGTMQVAVVLAFIFAGGVSLVLVPTLGWRAVFVVIFVSSLFGLYIRRGVPESPRWYQSRGRHNDAERAMRDIEERVREASGQPLPPPVPVAAEMEHDRNPLRTLLSARYRRRTAVAWGFWMFDLLGHYAITAWIAKLLVDKGMTVSSSIALVLVTYALGGIPGSLTSAGLMERLGRRPVYATSVLLCAVTAYLYGNAESTVAVVVAGTVMQFFLAAKSAGLYTYTPELFPTRARATGTGTSSTAGRVGAIVGPSLVPVLLVAWGYTATFAVLGGSFLLAALLVLALGPETRGRTLEQVSS